MGDIKTSDVYKYSAYSYPEDLWQNPERHGNNYCVFFVNVRSNSKLAKNKNLKVQNADGGDAPRSSAGAFGDRFSGNVLGGSSLIRTNTAICLYMPNTISMGHNVLYDNVELGLLGGAQAGSDFSLSEAAKTGAATITDSSGQILNTVGKALGAKGKTTAGKVLSGLGQSAENNKELLKNVAAATTGQVINPHVEVLFKGVDFRKFTFDFDFYPKTEAEQEQVREIISEFRFHMHPELADVGGSNRFFLFPSEFDISFYHKEEENKHMFALSSCALTNVTVDYTATGFFATHSQGEPVGIKMTLDFTELEILTKERLAELEFERYGTVKTEIDGFTHKN